ncbi:spore coat protein [Priestia taiwanensis]|uniref:Coat F domain protein n=1 Tax=Priestia taiwanensis TaxID=1347902 RepID=A0A917ESF6_9BACI|nr:spore coat protein [Priestia taiwanensis]MBM7364512.1 spore coat protein CotF [Priestia taiwanensis]GGE80926.1 hypothetical protein GCM10007140_33070 [Priestia taiwanensis]
MKIGNPETPFPQTPDMNDRDFLNDMLATEKYMTSSYATALHEASNETLYADLKTIYDATENCQRELFNLMFRKGWYKLEPIEAQKIQQAHQQFAGYSKQFPYQH